MARARELKKARRDARKAEIERQAAAALAEAWRDKPDEARPTEQRRGKGVFALRRVEDAPSVAVDEAPTELDRLYRAGVITADQLDGGQDLAALLRRTMVTRESRSCLDWTPVATGDDSEPTHAELRDAQERAEIYLACGVAVFTELRRVCHEHHQPRSIDRLRQGLDICARFWGGRG